MPKFATPAPEPELSPAHAKLAEVQRRLDDVDAAIKTELAHAARLDDMHKAVGPARAALAQHDAQNATAMANWAKGNVNGKPTTDAAKREELARDLANAEQSSAAATVAQEQFRQAAVAASAPIRGLRAELDEARRLVVLSDASELFAPIADAGATFMRLHRELNAARDAAMAGVEFGSGRYPELSAALAVFDSERRKAEAVPLEPPPEDRTFPGAQVAAEMRAAMSFPSTSTVR